MAELKTKLNSKNTKEFLESVEDPTRRSDSLEILELFSKWTNKQAEMWGSSIVGYGRLEYTNAAGKTNEWMELAFSPRKQNLTIYIMSGFTELGDLLNKLGPHSISKGCLYIKKLQDVDIKILEKIVLKSLALLKEHGIPGSH